jgi:hypothetical protein
VQRRQKIKKQREMRERDSIRAAGIAPKDHHRYLAAKKQRKLEVGRSSHQVYQSRRQRAYNENHSEEFDYIASSTNGGGVGNAGNYFENTAHLDQLRIENLVRSGQRRAEVLQQLEFDLLRAELSDSLGNVGNALSVLEQKELNRRMKEESIETTKKWWTKEELQLYNNEKGNVREGSSVTNDAYDGYTGEDITLVEARSKLKYLDRGSKKKRIKKQNEARQQLAKGRREMYGDKNSILSVHNDDRRRMREGKKWTPDLDRPRGGKRFQ